MRRAGTVAVVGLMVGIVGSCCGSSAVRESGQPHPIFRPVGGLTGELQARLDNPEMFLRGRNYHSTCVGWITSSCDSFRFSVRCDDGPVFTSGTELAGRHIDLPAPTFGAGTDAMHGYICCSRRHCIYSTTRAAKRDRFAAVCATLYRQMLRPSADSAEKFLKAVATPGEP